MVERDHSLVDPTEAFFSESMRRETVTGMRIVLTLETQDWTDHLNSPSAQRRKTYTPTVNENGF